jgi:hypothetical protein
LIRSAGLAIKPHVALRDPFPVPLPFLALPRPVAAQEFIAVPDLISDEAFYRLVACAAPPGGECAKPFIRWPRERRLRLRVGIAQISEEFADYRLDLVDRSVDRAIAEINGAGAHLYLERAYEGPFDVPDLPGRRAAGRRDRGHRGRRSGRLVDFHRTRCAALAR